MFDTRHLEMMSELPKILVLANCSFSNENSNGRTLGNFFNGYPKEKIAQFCTKNSNPNFDICDNYYCVTDKKALRSFFTFTEAMPDRFNENANGISCFGEQTQSLVQRTPLNYLIRNAIWNSELWQGKRFRKWLTDFMPDIIVLQVGAGAFMLNLARKISKKFGIPIIIYSSEAYYFDSKWYFNQGGMFSALFYRIFQRKYRSAYRKAMKQVSFCVYSCDKLKREFDKLFPLNSIALYTASNWEPFPIVTSEISSQTNFIYAGNLELNRGETICRIAEVLQEIDSTAKINVYSGVKPDIEEGLRKFDNIVFHGYVSYEQLKNAIAESDFILNVESTRSEDAKNILYGFSTKIADSLRSGKVLITVAPTECASVEYLKENGCFVIEDASAILPKLREIMCDTQARERLITRQIQIGRRNHDIQINAEKFREVLIEVYALSQDQSTSMHKVER